MTLSPQRGYKAEQQLNVLKYQAAGSCFGLPYLLLHL